ncbi:MAG: hypothetical protein COV35_09620 [Alphaproteobacteria bacterium CG11_big_fil_rev_8_21_14_0_20_39_49]|nr:MAG: hypothetical protein COV35_09620 [Alphaproteobacteria bacterium CG11_big_fil_rev_8_21_14_0_20_39_49]
MAVYQKLNAIFKHGWGYPESTLPKKERNNCKKIRELISYINFEFRECLINIAFVMGEFISASLT